MMDTANAMLKSSQSSQVNTTPSFSAVEAYDAKESAENGPPNPIPPAFDVIGAGGKPEYNSIADYEAANGGPIPGYSPVGTPLKQASGSSAATGNYGGYGGTPSAAPSATSGVYSGALGGESTSGLADAKSAGSVTTGGDASVQNLTDQQGNLAQVLTDQQIALGQGLDDARNEFVKSLNDAQTAFDQNVNTEYYTQLQSALNGSNLA